MKRTSEIARPVGFGEVWQVAFDPVVGHEQGGIRPALIVSGERFNQLPHSLCVVAPITSSVRAIPTHVLIAPPEGGITRPSVVMCDQLRTVSIERLQYRRGTVSSQTLEQVQDVIRLVFGF